MNHFIERIAKRFRGFKKTKTRIVIPGTFELDHVFVYDPIIPKIKTYLRKHHLAIISILIAIVVVPWGVFLTQQAEKHKIEAEKASQAKIIKSTTTYYFTPKTTKLATSIADGAECWGAGASARSDAFRCAVNNDIYDPCFYQSTWNYVDCPPSPEEHKIISVSKLDRNTIASDPNTPEIPWYLVLENGAVCRFYTGATDSIAGERIDYGCNNKRILSLPLNSEKEIFDIKCHNPDKERVEICKIKEVWY